MTKPNPATKAKKVTKKETAARRDRVAAAYRTVGDGAVVPMMSLGRVFDAGMAALEAGGGDREIGEAMAKVLEAVRVA
jgi:hypothetical protein